MNSKIVLSKEVFARMLEVNLINIEVLEMHFAVTEFTSQYDSKILVALQPLVDWKEFVVE